MPTAVLPAWRCARAVGPGGRVFAFEPALTTAACLERTARVNRLDQLVALPFALSDAPRPVVSRFATERGMIDSQLSADGPLEMTAIIAVGLDAIWEGISAGNSVVHGIKIDVQGMELDALRGMRRLLAACRPKIVLEIHRDVSRDGHPGASRIVRLPARQRADRRHAGCVRRPAEQRELHLSGEPVFGRRRGRTRVAQGSAGRRSRSRVISLASSAEDGGSTCPFEAAHELGMPGLDLANDFPEYVERSR